MNISLPALATAAALAAVTFTALPATAAPIAAQPAFANSNAQIEFVRNQRHARRHVNVNRHRNVFRHRFANPRRHTVRRYFRGVPYAHNHWRYGHCIPVGTGAYLCWN